MVKSWRHCTGGLGTHALGAAVAAIAIGFAAPAFADSGSGPRVIMAQGLIPPGDIPDPNGEQGPDNAALLLRVERLESDLRRATGAIEELQNQNQRLADELKRFREDVEFRLGGNKPAPAAPVAAAPAAAQPIRKSDAFDPGAQPSAPGAPQPLGTTHPSAPLDLTTPARVAEAPPPGAPLKPADNGPTVIGSGLDFADGPRGQFNSAVESYKAGQYQTAEEGFKTFLTANNGHKLAPDAIFYLGETYLQRSRPREAAEQYLRLSTDYAKSPKAPEGMLRLGQSLAMLGNGEQACATFAELGHRYPTASTTVKKGVEREMQKDHC